MFDILFFLTGWGRGITYFLLILKKSGNRKEGTHLRYLKRVEERLNKRKLGVNLTDQLKILSKDLMRTLLKEKMHHDAIEFLGNLLKHYDEYILDVADYFQVECISMQCC